jgi:hypothetical protein
MVQGSTTNGTTLPSITKEREAKGNKVTASERLLNKRQKKPRGTSKQSKGNTDPTRRTGVQARRGG